MNSETEPMSLAGQQKHDQLLATRKVEDDLRLRKLLAAKRITWMILLAGAFLCFYLMDKLSEALSVFG